MENFHGLVPRFAVILFAVGCSPSVGPPAGPSVSTLSRGASACLPSNGCYSDSDPRRPDLACPANRQISLAGPLGNCASPDGWITRRLFPEHHGELHKYCVHSMKDAPSPIDLEQLPPSARRDCRAVAAQAGPWDEKNAAALQEAFFEQVEQVDSMPAASPAPEPTKVLVIDSAVTGPFPNPQTGQMQHGPALGEMIRRLTCPGNAGACTGIVSTGLALSLAINPATTVLESNPTEGGYLGSLTETALAIVDRVDYALSTPGSQNIIINLSLGWDPYWGGTITNDWSELPPPARAVYSAIAYAGCQGALVVAASGNKTGGPDETAGPTFPGGWETEPAPDEDRCKDFNLQTQTPTEPYAPLLYAVGGVDGRDHPLLNERDASRPRIVAPGHHMAVIRNTGASTTPMTGSSVSTAVVSAAAAAAWAYLPNRSAHEIMHLVFNSGEPLGLPVDVCHGHCADEAHRASVCRSVARACALRGTCIDPPPCPVGGPGRDARPSSIDTSAAPPLKVQLAKELRQVTPKGCDIPIWTDTDDGPENACPSDLFYSYYAASHLVPQPVVIVCPTCGLNRASVDGESELNLALAFDAPSDLTDARLRIEYDSGEEALVDLSLIEQQDLQSTTVVVTNIPVDIENVAAAALDFVINDQYSTSSEILVLD